MSRSRIEFSQKVTNREMELLGEVEVRRRVVLSFLYSIEQLIREKIQLTTQICEVVPSVDYNLSPFQFSEQFGTEYCTALIVMTPKELEEHDAERCRICQVNQYALEAMAATEGATC